MSEYRNVFISGTSSGLGFGLAKYYLEGGAQVWGCSRRPCPDLEKSFPENYHHFQVDFEQLDQLGGKLTSSLPKDHAWDLAVFNAGILGEIQDMGEVSLDTLKQLMDVNLWANKVLFDYFLRLEGAPRQIVAISSGASVSGSRGWNGYSISKAALNMMVKLYAQEAPKSHLISFAPGLIDTAMQDYLTNLPEDERYSTVERLKEAKGTSKMPNEIEAAKQLAAVFPRLVEHESGSFVDVRNLL